MSDDFEPPTPQAVPPLGRLHRTVEINTDEAALLADWLSISEDLKFAQHCLKLLIASSQISDEDLDMATQVTRQSLWSSALIYYRRCFATGVRVRLDSSRIVGLAENAAEYHEWLMNLANKLIAHSVNPFEQMKVGAVIDEQEQTILGMAHIHARAVGWQKDGLDQFGRFIGLLRSNLVDPEIEQLNAVALASAQKRPFEELAGLPTLRIHGADPEDAGRRRR